MNNSMIWARCSQRMQVRDRQHQENGNQEAGAPSPGSAAGRRETPGLTTPAGSASPGEHLMKVTMEMEMNHYPPSVTYVYGVCCA